MSSLRAASRRRAGPPFRRCIRAASDSLRCRPCRTLPRQRCSSPGPSSICCSTSAIRRSSRPGSTFSPRSTPPCCSAAIARSWCGGATACRGPRSRAGGARGGGARLPHRRRGGVALLQPAHRRGPRPAHLRARWCGCCARRWPGPSCWAACSCWPAAPSGSRRSPPGRCGRPSAPSHRPSSAGCSARSPPSACCCRRCCRPTAVGACGWAPSGPAWCRGCTDEIGGSRGSTTSAGPRRRGCTPRPPRCGPFPTAWRSSAAATCSCSSSSRTGPPCSSSPITCAGSCPVYQGIDAQLARRGLPGRLQSARLAHLRRPLAARPPGHRHRRACRQPDHRRPGAGDPPQDHGPLLSRGRLSHRARHAGQHPPGPLSLGVRLRQGLLLVGPRLSRPPLRVRLDARPVRGRLRPPQGGGRRLDAPAGRIRAGLEPRPLGPAAAVHRGLVGARRRPRVLGAAPGPLSHQLEQPAPGHPRRTCTRSPTTCGWWPTT